ncbi:MAG: hypothetical protein AAFQ80_20465 [Cyanobacteria bacterium J06621_8]
MVEKNIRELIQISAYCLSDRSKIYLPESCIEIDKEKFVAIGLEKSKAAEHWEDEDCINILILVKADDGKYYFSKIEHPVDILSPRNVNDDLKIYWVEDTAKPLENELISNLYTLNDSRSEYTLTINEKPFQIYEKYLCHLISVGYETWEYYNKSKVEVSGYLRVRCQFSSKWFTNALDHLPLKTLEYPISINLLLQTSIFEYQPFELWSGNLTVDGFKVKLESR